VNTRPAALVFGASGSLGSACIESLSSEFETYSGGRSQEHLKINSTFDAVVWAQGVNQTKQFLASTEDDWEQVLESNLHFVRRSVLELIEHKLVNNPASFVFISSIWSKYSKVEKSAYIVSKAALEGLARSLAFEFADRNIRVNCVLPGVVDNAMTRKNLTQTQTDKVELETPGRSLVTAKHVANTVAFLCSKKSLGINGQSIVVDNGWTIARYI
jgi:NAD(P)-dependent dehydrogenase (short-subunit alcohol dehydrogenase family)